MKNHYVKTLLSKLHCIIMVVIIVVSILPISANKAKAEWVEVTYDCERCSHVKTTEDIFFGKIKQTSDCWWANGVLKGTIIGTVYMSVSASKTSNATRYTYYQGVSYGSTYGMAYDIIVTMSPKSSVSAKSYVSKSGNFRTYSRNSIGVNKTVYVGSEDLYNYCYVPASTKTGFLYDWTPRKKQSTAGFDNLDVHFSVDLLKRTPSISLGKKIEITDDFVNGADMSDPSQGLYKTRYDYKKYNKLGFCSADRKKRIFSTTTVQNGVYWRNKTLTHTGYVYTSAKFAICDSKTWPTEYGSAIATFASVKLIINGE